MQYNPDRQYEICENRDDCFFGDYPTVAEVNSGLAPSVTVAWLIGQLYDLSEYCGCKDKLDDSQIEQCARIIASKFFYLKVSELMLFFYNFKAGEYGQFYGAVDPMRITNAMQRFCAERDNAIAKHEQRERERKQREDLAANPPVTWEEYCERHGMQQSNPIDSLSLGGQTSANVKRQDIGGGKR